MAPKKEVTILLKATDQATRVLENAAKNSLPAFAKRVAGLAAGFVSLNAGVDILKDTITKALDAEKATSALTAALKSQGLSVVQNLPHLTAFAGSLSRVTAADDEAIQGAQKLLISIGRLTGSALDRATKAALDLSAGLGIELSDAAEKIARAANGATRSFTQLGVKFREGADDAEKFQTVLGFVNDRFGGAAQAQVETMAGKIEQLTKAWGELQEAVGKKVAFNPTIGGGLDKLIEALNVASTMVESEGVKATTDLFEAAADLNPQALLELFDRMERLKIDDSVTAALAGKTGIFGLDPGGLKIAVDQIDGIISATEAAEKAAKKAAAEYAVWLKTFEAREVTLPLPAAGGPFAGMGDQAALSEHLDATALQTRLDLLNQFPDALATISDGFMQLGDDVDNTSAKVMTFGEEMTATLEFAAGQAAVELGDALVDAAFGAQVAWDEAIRNIIKGLVKAVVQALILKAISTAITGGAGAALSGGGVAGGGTMYRGDGGMVPAYAASGIFIPRGTDTVPAMLTRGEIVLPSGVSRDILGGRASVVPSGSGRSIHVTINAVDGPSVEAMLLRNPDALVSAMARIDARRG